MWFFSELYINRQLYVEWHERSGIDSATKVMAMAMTTHDADWNTKAEKGS